MHPRDRAELILKVKVTILLVSLFSAIAEVWLILFNLLDSGGFKVGGLIFFLAITILSVLSIVSSNKK